VVDQQEGDAVKQEDLKVFKDRIEVLGFSFILRKLKISGGFNFNKLQALYIHSEWG